jgi:hypothetical protein
MVEGGRHGAAMLAPGLAFRGDEPFAEARLENAASDLGFPIVRRVVEQNMLDRPRLVDQEPAASEHASSRRCRVRRLPHRRWRPCCRAGAEEL